MKKKRKLFGILFSLALMTGLLLGMPLTAYAGELHTHNDINFVAWTETDRLPGADDLIEGVGNFYLTQDVIISSTWTVPTGSVNLCLDGHSITKSSDSNGNVIIIGSGATLNLYDKADNSGMITGGHGVYNGGGVYVNGGNFVMYGGKITGNTINSTTGNSANCGGGVALASGSFTMNGGVVSNNAGGMKGGNYQYHKGGGGVGVTGGSFTMNGGEIFGNQAYNGGGLYLHNNITPVINGGEIHDNTASASGGAVYAIGQVNLYVKGGKIYNNSAATSGGIWLTWRTVSGVKRGATVHVSGGELYGNHSVNTGGAIGCNTNASFYLSGNPSIYDNNYGNDNINCNIYIVSGTIRLEAELGDEAYIGVTTGTKPTSTGNVVFTNGLSGKGLPSNFYSDNDDYAVMATAAGEAQLVVKFPVAYDANGATSGTVPADSDSPYPSGSTVPVLSKGNLIKQGYDFAGWKIGTAETIYANSADYITGAEENFTISGSTTLTAQWDAIPATAPIISAQPQDLNLVYGYTEGSLSVTAAAATDTLYNTLDYQWYSNTTASNEGGTAISENGTSATYTIPANKTAGTTEYYYCVVTATRSDNNQTASKTTSVAAVMVRLSQEAPDVAGFTVTDATDATSADGQISGVTTAMEYSVDGGTTWTAAAGTTITGLNPGSVQIRLAADDTHFASDAVTVTVGDAALISAKTNAVNTVNAVNAGDYITADQDTVANAKTTALAAIEAATTEAEVTAALTAFNTAIAACTTQAAADLATAKTNAANTVNGVNATDYITADQETVTNAKTTALAAIEAATTEAEVTAALTAFNTAIAACTTQAAADLAAANAVSDTITALPDFNNVTADNKAAIEAARAAYDALTDDQKAKVSADTLKKLSDAEDKLVIIQVMSEVSAKTGSGMTYTGNSIQLINTPTTALPAGYTMKYAVTTENTAPADKLYTTSIPAKIDAGT